jgi:transcriptional regulator with GAF, ATPase, and Fis domain
MSRNLSRLLIVIGATVVVLGYCLGLILHVRSSPDIGIHSTFSLKVGRFYPQYLRDAEPGTPSNLVGWTIRQVGPRPVEDWPEFIRALRELQSHPPDSETAGTFVRHGDQDWVRVVLQQSESEKPIAIWCVLGHPPLESTLPALLWLILEVGMFVIGALVYWKRPGDRFAGTFFALTIVAVGAYLGGYHWSQIVTQPILMVLFVVSAILLAPVTLHFHHVFPRPKPWLEKHPWLTLLAIYGLPALTGIAVIAGFFWVRTLFRSGAASELVREAMYWHRRGLYVSVIVSAAWFTAGVAALIHSYFRATEPGERNQVRWILSGSLIALIPIAYSLYLVVFDPLDFVGGGAAWPMFAASACITVAFTVSITRYRLLRLDQLIGSGLLFFTISFLAVFVYYVLVFAGMLVVGSQVISGPSLEQAFLVSLTAVILLGVLDLIRARLNRSLRYVYRRDKRQLDRTLHELSEAIEHLVEPPTLARHLLDASAELLAVSRGALYLSEGEPPLFHMAGHRGEPPALTELARGCPLVDTLERRPLLTADEPYDAAAEQLQVLGGEVALALTQDDRVLGFLILGPKAHGFYLTEDFNLLSGLAPIAALALQSASGRKAIESLNRDVQQKVEKISELQERILTLQRQLLRQSAEPQPKDRAPNATIPQTGESEHALVGSSAVVGQLLELVHKVAQSPSAVLIRGESGTGKELIARAIHDASSRSGKPFVKVHCAALSPSLLESELFGHVKGAFTGATANKVGRFELANGGTLFLDEIGDVNLDVQVKLLRVLQEKVFERVGSSEPVRVDVRIVAATHQNLERLIQLEKFREDLYYRLNVIPISAPPLRERREDIPELVGYFLGQFARQTGKPIPEVDDEAMTALRNFSWPGNIRQLRNVVERALVVAEGPVIQLSDLAEEVRIGTVLTTSTVRPMELVPQRRNRRAAKEERLRLERDELLRALADARGNKAEAARVLGIPRSTLTSRMQKHGLL